MSKIEELRSPIVLENGQNFFDQPPFDTIVANIARKNGAEAWVVRYQINHATEVNKKALGDSRTWRLNPSQKISDLMEGFIDPFEIDTILKLRAANNLAPNIFLLSFATAGKKLREYPHWAEYIATQKTPDYSPSGDYNGKNGFFYTESYPSWVMRRLVKTPLLPLLRREFPGYFNLDSPHNNPPQAETPRPLSILTWRIPLVESEVRVS